ncbi:DUF1015 domain-containing protein [Seleniivibrio woodruffii]|uniref:Uncharacterized protein (DUF1015 family) n=1 Tax=Seleniivibrio woodruffii TaxID=1078050 RepID=A0A4R1KD05_9BACT|nr:DUF1015 domain-containing protein [Seleniivibrio woodruffii]TCK62445.1 uncharacterized protein (DUF1015 family) [Seleniivibrio woodruffii]TVZ34437.1 uncharacterized protein (DUF1015 family) [Seleniivibrio woodruffii]
MSIVRPFAGVRYNLEEVLLKSVVAPPYDVISPEMKQELKDKSPYNVVTLDLPDGADDKYANAAALYKEYLDNKILVKDQKPGFYVYEQVYTYGGKEYVRTGFVGLLKIEELGKGSVYPHEKTLSGPKKDRFELMKACKTNFSQIFGLYMDKDNRMNLVFNEAKKNMPTASAMDDDGVKNTIWSVQNENTVRMIEEFMKDKAIYIADGHHRYETALNYRDYAREQNADMEKEEKPYDYVMMMFVNFYDEGLKIFPTHRVLEVDSSFSFEAFKEKLRFDFTIEKLADAAAADAYVNDASGERTMAIYYDNTYYGIKANDEVIENLAQVYRKVDTYLLQEGIMKKFLNVSDERLLKKEGVYFVQTLEQIEKLAADKKAVGFILKGVDIEIVREISESGMVMPQKSTYFYPKLQTGLVIYQF